MRATSVRASAELHLNKAKIDPELDFFAAVASYDLSGLYLARLVWPAVE